MYQMCPEQERGTKGRVSEGAEKADGGVDKSAALQMVLRDAFLPEDLASRDILQHVTQSEEDPPHSF